jgi:hypothetical protein
MGNFQSSSKTLNKNKPTNSEQRNINGIFFSSAKIIESYLDNPPNKKIPQNEQVPCPSLDSPNSNTLESHETFDINSIINGDSPDISIAVLHQNHQSNNLSILENIHFEQRPFQNNKQINTNPLVLTKEEHIDKIPSLSL